MNILKNRLPAKGSPKRADAQHVIRMLNRKGDEVLATWTVGDTVAEELAQSVMDQKVREGWLVFKARPGVKPEGPERTFDPAVQEYMVLAPFAGG